MTETKDTRNTGTAVAEPEEEWLSNNPTAAERPSESRAAWNETEVASLFEDDEAEQFRADWLEIQSRFVDDPNAAVRDADELVNHVLENITTVFADKRLVLESQWKRGDTVSTEDLRIALKRYRSLFDRLLALAS